MNNEVVKVLQEWFDEERNNRVTPNNMEALVRKVVQVLEALNTPKGAGIDEQDNGTPS